MCPMCIGSEVWPDKASGRRIGAGNGNCPVCVVEVSSERLWVGTKSVCCFCRAYSMNNGQPRLGHYSWEEVCLHLAATSHLTASSIIKPRREALGSTISINVTGAPAIGLLAPAGSHTALLLGVRKHRRGEACRVILER